MYVIRGNTYSVKEEIKKESNIGLQWDKENRVWLCENTFPLDKQCYKKANISFEDVGDEFQPKPTPQQGINRLIQKYMKKDTEEAITIVDDLQWLLDECDWYRR